jgi:hypothetical protein
MSAESAREGALEGTGERIEQEITEETEGEQEEQKETKETKEEQKVPDVQPGPVDLTALNDHANVVPALSQGEREGAVRAEHPAGEVFFHGSAEEVTEGEAKEIARRQLARSGLLRGQKVRVAD